MDEQLHLSQWDETLWNWVDGTLEPVQKASTQRHLEQCGCCQQHLDRLYALEQRLRLGLPGLRLDSTFDEKLLSQLPPLGVTQRAMDD
jgi:anti-sigma factor RsiW